MNIIARLRKLGYERCGPLFRSIDIDRHQASLSAIAIPGMRPLMPKRPLDARPSGRSPGLRTVLDNEPGPARSTLVRRRSLAPEQHRPTPFVGRKAELRRLLDAWSRATAGHGQVVLLSGDAGVGKSRLARELRPSQPHTVLWHRCSPEHAFRPLHPVIGLLQELPGLPEAEKEASGRQPGLTPQRLRSRTFESLLARIEQLAHLASMPRKRKSGARTKSGRLNRAYRGAARGDP